MRITKGTFQEVLYGTWDKRVWDDKWSCQMFYIQPGGLLDPNVVQDASGEVIQNMLSGLDITRFINKSKSSDNRYGYNMKGFLENKDSKELHDALDTLYHIRETLTDGLNLNQLLCRYEDSGVNLDAAQIRELLTQYNTKALECRERICSIAATNSDIFKTVDFAIYKQHIQSLGYVGCTLPEFLNIIYTIMSRYNVEGDIFYGNKEINNRLLFIPLLEVMVVTKLEKLDALSFRIEFLKAIDKNTQYSKFLANILHNISVLNAFVKYSFKIYKEINKLKSKNIIKLILEINDNTSFIEKL